MSNKHVVEQVDWRWYTDATPDSSMVALAGENTKPTLTGAQMQDAIVRLRIQIHETGGTDGTAQSIELQYSSDAGTTWHTFEDDPPSDTDAFFRWIDGASTAGGTISSRLLGGTDADGTYHEVADATEVVLANAYHEIDCAVQVHWPAPDVDLLFRVVYGGTALVVASGSSAIALRTSTAANRPHAVGHLRSETGPLVNRSFRHSCMERSFFDGTRWWFFMVDEENTDTVDIWSWDGDGEVWVNRGSRTFSTNIEHGAFDVAFKLISGNPVFVIAATDADADTNVFLWRGEISGTSITWDPASEQTITVDIGKNVVAVSYDDGGYIWLGGYDTTAGDVWAVRSTNADTGTSWTTGWGTVRVLTDQSDTGGRIPVAIIGLASDRALMIWIGSGATDLRWCAVSASGWGTPGQVNSTTDANDCNMGVARGGGFVYLVHTDTTVSSGGNWALRVFSESGETWADGTSPSQADPAGSNDGLALSYDDSNDVLYVFTSDTVGGNSRTVSYRSYAGPGASGTWNTGGLQTITPTGDRGNGDVTSAPRLLGGNTIVVFFQFNDDGTEGYYHTIEEHHEVLAGAALVTAVEATASALAGVPVVTAASTITAVEATASALAGVAAVFVTAIVTAVEATASALAGVPAVSAGANITAVAATASALAGVPAVTVVATITAVEATASALAGVPVVTGGGAVIVTAVEATASALAGVPAVTGAASVTAIAATASALAGVPAVTVVATITALAATASALAGVPVVTGGGAVIVTAVEATASALAGVPVVTGGGGAIVTAVAATASALAGVPAVTAVATITAIAATASALAGVPAVTGAASVTAVAATASALAGVPAVTVVATITALAATASALAGVPTLTAAATITAVAATASALAGVPAVTGAAIAIGALLLTGVSANIILTGRSDGLDLAGAEGNLRLEARV